MNTLTLLFSGDSNIVQIDDSESDREGYDPFEALYMKVIMLALDDLSKGKILYKLSALYFFRSENFATCLYNLGCDGDTVDFIFKKMERILEGVEEDLVRKGRCPDTRLTHRYFSDALDEDDYKLQERRSEKTLNSKSKKITKIPLHKYRQGDLLDNLQECG